LVFGPGFGDDCAVFCAVKAACFAGARAARP